MPVLDKIMKAEAQAESIREEAKNEVARMLDENNKDNTIKVQSMLEEAKNEIKRLNDETTNHLKQLEADAKDECVRLNEADSVLAKTHLDETVDFILRKVTDS